MWTVSPSKSDHLIPTASPIRSPVAARKITSVEYGSCNREAIAATCWEVRIVRFTLEPASGNFTPEQGFFPIQSHATAHDRTRLSEALIPRRVLRQYFF